jgi:dienelactone hydrolase
MSRQRLIVAVVFHWLLLLVGTLSCSGADVLTGPWNLAELKRPPEAEFGPRQGLLQTVYYQGEPLQGKPTRVFAYLGRPAEGEGPFPAVVLVHGGGGKAFSAWAEHWAKRGYVALAMDLAGHGPNGKLPDGGPDQSDGVKFKDFSSDTVRDMWTYHAVAAALRGHSLLAAQPYVDPKRTAVTGISWGGYLTCIIAGLDDRFQAAVPVYGCGFLHESSHWLEPNFRPMSAELRERWVTNFDPSRYLPGVRCPIMFLNGTNDFAYPLDSYRKSYSLVTAPVTVSVQVRLPHGHIWTFPEVDQFIDSAVRGGDPVPRCGPLALTDDRAFASATVQSKRPIKQVQLHFTTNEGPWKDRMWQSVDAELRDGAVRGKLPEGRPLVCFLSVKDDRGVTVSTTHLELSAP